jgi:hypothetical protein
MANNSASGPESAPTYHSAAMVGATNGPIDQCRENKALRIEASAQDIERAKP